MKGTYKHMYVGHLFTCALGQNYMFTPPAYICFHTYVYIHLPGVFGAKLEQRTVHMAMSDRDVSMLAAAAFLLIKPQKRLEICETI